MKKSLVLVCAMLLVCSALFAQSKPKPIIVGAAVAQSGMMVPYDDPPTKAAQMAINDINAKGGLLGRPIELVIADTKSDMTEGANAAAEVIEKGAALVIASCDFDFGGASALVAQQKGIPVISTCAADPKFGVQGIGKYAYTMSTSVTSQGAMCAEWAYKKGFRNPFILTDVALEYTKTLGKYFRSRWVELAGEKSICGEDTYHGVNDTSIAGQITRIKNASTKPDFLMFAGTINGGSIVRQLRANGVDIPMVASEAMDGDYWLKAVPNLSKFYVLVYGSIFGNDPDPKVKAFFEKFEKVYGARPVTAHAITGYSLIEAWALAVKRAGSLDADKVIAELNNFQAEPLLIGSTTFTENLHINVSRPMLMMEIVNGKHVPLGRVELVNAPQIVF